MWDQRVLSLNPKPNRDAYGETLVKIGRENPRIVVMDGDLADSCRTYMFAKECPSRYIQMGISEQDMVNTAVGLALCGLIPFVSTFAAFFCRCYDQVRYTVAYHKANVKLVSTHSGICIGEDGASAQAINDISMMRCLPNFTVIVPADYTSTKTCIERVAKEVGPFYVRLNRQETAIVYEREEDFSYGQGNLLLEGDDVAIVAAGATVPEALLAALKLKEEGIRARVIDLHMIKPIDGATLYKAAKDTGRIVTAEDHSIIGGLGGAVAEFLSENYPVSLSRVGLLDTFAESAKPRELMDKYGISSLQIRNLAKKLMASSSLPR